MFTLKKTEKLQKLATRLAKQATPKTGNKKVMKMSYLDKNVSCHKTF